MTPWATMVQLHDLDLLLEEARDPVLARRSQGLGFRASDRAAVERLRAQLHARLDRRWLHVYERAQRRYGRAVATVRDRVCQGCYITLPTSASPAPDALTICESCGRILFWI